MICSMKTYIKNIGKSTWFKTERESGNVKNKIKNIIKRCIEGDQNG